jgi:hypothetical protein
MHPSQSEGPAQDEEYLLAENEAALAATLALMTGFGHGCCDAHRPVMAARVAEQLESLACAGGFSSDMRSLLGRLQQRWQAVADAGAPARSRRAMPEAAEPMPQAQPVPHVLWHAPLDTLQ